VTIIPRGRALGVTHWLPEKDKYHRTKDEMLASLQVALGGRAAEEIAFSTVTSGASSDFQNATKLAREMVCHYGMSEKLGTVIYSQGSGTYDYSQDTAELIDEEVRALLKQCYEAAKVILNEHRDKLDLLSQALLEKETLYSGEIYTLLNITPRIEHSFGS
jgi:cell division protease FtsH